MSNPPVLTIDANCCNYAWQYTIGKCPTGLPGATKMCDFVNVTLSTCAVAWHDVLEAELNGNVAAEFIERWIKSRFLESPPLAVRVERIALPASTESALGTEYRIKSNGRDRRYIQVAYATETRVIVTFDAACFRKSHCSKPRKPPLDRFLRKKLGIEVTDVDECVAAYP